METENEISDALRKRIADREAIKVPSAIIGLPEKVEQPSAIVGLPTKTKK